MTLKRSAILLASASLALTPAGALAQNAATHADDGFVADDTTITNTQPVDHEDDDDFPWGLLGLLGLAGLLGLKKRDDRDVHVDARRNTR